MKSTSTLCAALVPPGRWACVLIMTMSALTAAAAPQAVYRLAPIRGQVVDQATKLPLENAVVNAAWVLETLDPAQTAGINYLYIQQARSDKGGRFVVFPPDKPLSVTGFKLKEGGDPLVTIYAAGHLSQLLENGSRAKKGRFTPFNQSGTHMPTCKWDGKIIPLGKIKNDPDGALHAKEIGLWRNNLETALSAASWRGNSEAALANQQLLLNLILQECGKLTESQRHEVCTGRLSAPEKVQAVPLPTNQPVINVIIVQPKPGQGAGSAQP